MGNITQIVFFNQTFGMGGAENLYKNLFQYFSDQHISVRVYTTFPRFANTLDFLPKVSLIPLKIDLIGDWKGLLKGLPQLPLGFLYYGYLVWKNRHTDILFISGYIEKILATPWAKLFGVPVVWLEHAPLYDFLGLFLGFPRFLYQLVLPLPDQVIVYSQNTARDLTRKFHFPTTKITLIPNGIAVPDQKVEAQPHHVVCVSRLQPGKGQDLLLLAWSQVKKQIQDATLTLVGEGDFLGELKALVSQNNLASSVTFTGWVKDPLPYISAGSVFVFPTVWPLEGFGLVAVEALALSRPVVGFDFGPVPEIITPDVGILVPPSDTSALAAAIIKILKSPSLRSKLGQAGRRRYEKMYTPQKMGQAYLQVFSHAANS